MDSPPIHHIVQAGVDFAEYSLSKLTSDAEHLEKVVYSDECHYTSSCGVNKQKCQVWGKERLQEICEVQHGPNSILVWCVKTEKGITF